MRNLLIALVVMLSLAACATSSGSYVDPETHAKFVKGKTTYDDVINKLGEPTSTSIQSNGTKEIAYRYSHRASDAANRVFIVSAFVDQPKSGVQEATYTFRNNILIDSKFETAGAAVPR